jgi:hypothetical protein
MKDENLNPTHLNRMKGGGGAHQWSTTVKMWHDDESGAKNALAPYTGSNEINLKLIWVGPLLQHIFK